MKEGVINLCSWEFSQATYWDEKKIADLRVNLILGAWWYGKYAYFGNLCEGISLSLSLSLSLFLSLSLSLHNLLMYPVTRWQMCKIADEPVDITPIRTDPRHTATDHKSPSESLDRSLNASISCRVIPYCLYEMRQNLKVLSPSVLL